jgi:MFS family permease
VQGIGAAMLFAVSLAMLANAFPDIRQRTGALAVYGATIGGSFAVGPLLGGALTSGLDWRWIFLVNLPIGVLMLAATHRHVVESRDERAHPVDVPGLVLLTGGLFLLVFGLLNGNEDGWGSTSIVATLGGAAALLAAFVAVEALQARPMLPLGWFRNRAFTGAQIGAFAISSSFFAVFLYTTIYLQQVLGLSAIEAGLVYLPGTIVMFVVSGATAGLGDKVSARTMMAVGLALVAAGQALMLLTTATSSWALALPGAVVALIGTGLFNPAVTAVGVGSVPERQSGLAAGIIDTFRQAGIAVGVAALGALVPAGAAFGGSKTDYVSGMHDALLVCVAICVIGAIAVAMLVPAGRRWAAGADDAAPSTEEAAVTAPALVAEPVAA